MRINVNHDPSEYVNIAIRFWILRVFSRITKQRRSLSIYILIAFLLVYMINPLLGFGLIIITFIIILIDFIVTINEAFLEKKKTKAYLEEDGGSIEIHTDGYFCYSQHNREYKRVEWSDIYEYCRLEKPQAFSFKSKITKETYTIIGMEMESSDFLILKSILESSISTKPLV
ncbi:MAG: hypothetical protein IPL46_10175 [Saprospiraceae bacterium]|nr:hypothetical protein [Saprospiraceae bacterium]